MVAAPTTYNNAVRMSPAYCDLHWAAIGYYVMPPHDIRLNALPHWD